MPIYENQTTLAREVDVAQIFLNKVIAPNYGQGFSFEKLPLEQRIDFQLSLNRRPCAFFEVRGRSSKHQGSPTWFIDAAKVIAGLRLAQSHRCPFWLIFAWGDQYFYSRITPQTPYFTKPGGRTDRNDPFDTDLMAHFSPSLFQRFH